MNLDVFSQEFMWVQRGQAPLQRTKFFMLIFPAMAMAPQPHQLRPGGLNGQVFEGNEPSLKAKQ